MTDRESIIFWAEHMKNEDALKCLNDIAFTIYRQVCEGKWDNNEKGVK